MVDWEGVAGCKFLNIDEILLCSLLKEKIIKHSFEARLVMNLPDMNGCGLRVKWTRLGA